MTRMQLQLICAGILLIGIIGKATDSICTCVVQTSNGPVRGRILKTARKNVEYASFKEIPYAKPPEGDLRFQPPVEIEKWFNIYDAGSEGNVCIQYKNGRIIGSENCLFLSVHTPHADFTKINENNLKAVMVWIHGGAYSFGSSNTYRQGPDFILEEDVILVSMNYRLGPLGFLHLNHRNATGNMGLKDQNLALKWVKKNIAKFGGDPNKITIFGQSAGSISVDSHILSNMSAGLFNRSIAMSGSALNLLWGMQTSSEAHLQAKKLASKLGSKAKTTEEILQVLKTAPAEDIIRKTLEMSLLPFRPTVERQFDVNNEKFLSKCAADKYRCGEFNKGSHMLGFTSLEAKPVVDVDILKLILRANETLKSASIMFKNLALDRFLQSGTLGSINRAGFKKLANMLSDLFFITGIDSKQRLLIKRNNHPVYYYRFSFDSKLPTMLENRHYLYNISGVQHADDLMYVFYVSPTQFHNNNPEIELTINRYVRLLTNFAKYGNPTPNGEKDDLLKVIWPSSGILGFHLEINKELTVGLRPIGVDVKINQALGVGSSRHLNDCF